MNYGDLPLQVVKDLWLARFGTRVKFDALTKIHRQECLAIDGTSKTPIDSMYRRLIGDRAIAIENVDAVCWVYWVEEEPHAAR